MAEDFRRRGVVAIEGPSFSGKSTLVANLLSYFGKLAIGLPCYVAVHHSAGIKTALPEVPAKSIEEEIHSVKAFLELEILRNIAANKCPEVLVIQDRSIHTLLAHAYALRFVNKVDSYSEVVKLVSSTQGYLSPHAVLYIDVPQDILEKRSQTAFRPPSNGAAFFLNKEYNQGFRSYFMQPQLHPDSPKVITIDGTLGQSALVNLAVQAITPYVP